jgi:hypothetical protein
MVSMKFKLCEPDRLMWPGKYGLIGTQGSAEFSEIDFSTWKDAVERSERIVEVPLGMEGQACTYIFASLRSLGRVELVYQHGYVWPVNPPLAGREIMEELILHLNESA